MGKLSGMGRSLVRLGATAAGLLALVFATGGSAPAAVHDREAHPPHHVHGGATATYQSGYQPSQLWRAYGFAGLSCNAPASNTCGSGQTIAIVDAYDDPSAESDLATFDSQFGLPACTSANGCFTKATPQGTPKTNGNWALEISLDVQWAHAIAPGAKILLVESASNSFSSLLGAVDYAVGQGAHVVSMSWGSSGEFSTETSYDSHFTATGVTFTASSGDNGAGVIYPAASPYVTAVGGTNLPLDASGNLTGAESAWSGSGGGVSLYEARPAYQNGFNGNGGRGVPDVSYNADPNTGVAVYDSTSYFGQTGWFVIGGTSAGAPQWAGLVAIADSLRSSPLSGANGALYQAASGSAYATNYRDIVSGTNGSCGALCTAGVGYDFVTGLGSPLANALVPALAPSATVSGSLSFQTAPQTLTAGSPSGPMAVQLSSAAASPVNVTLSSSSAAGSFSGSASGPWSATLTVTIPAGSLASPSFYYADTKAGSPTLTASATGYTSATQTETVNAAALATLTISPGSATVAVGGTQSFSASGADAYGNAVGVTPTWSVSPALGSFSPNPGNPVTFSATSTGSGTVTAAVGSVSATASLTVVAAGSVSVASITYGLQGALSQHLLITVALVDGKGNPVAGASVSITLSRNGASYGSATGTTGTDGKVTFKATNAPSGCYTTTVTKVTASGLTWDGLTPANQFCK